ncbi:SLC13 family permease [uncultured Jatrophihabitans sp.]|uniref:SLC13 family permease n=1 Tax=uncultured Jatrophihabitans sp. TaxID=1610747 RepID=UPI0035C9483B
MPGAFADVVAVVLLVAALAFAVARPRGLSEALVAVPAAGLLVALGVEPGRAALRTLREIGPTVGFLAAILLFGHLCAEAGVFDYLANRAARASRGSPTRLLLRAVTMAALVTATLTLDATVVLVTPVLVATARRMQIPPRPFTYTSVRLANSGSLLLPVSNLTNLLAFGAAGLSFGRFTTLMALPWLLACTLEWAALRVFFRRDLRTRAKNIDTTLPAPRYALSVFAVTVVLFVVTSATHVAPAWAAALGSVALLVPRVLQRDVRPLTIIDAASPGFCAFVLALAVIVNAVTRHGLGAHLADLVPSGTSFVALLATALLAALLANVVNNLPATLALLPAVAGQPALVLAVLLGVNIGPNLAYPGSLATLLWRRLLPHDLRPRAAQFHTLGAVTVPVLLVVGSAALWLATVTVGT